MKILLNSTTVFPLPPPGYAGTEWIVYDLAVNLNRMGHQVVVACPKGSTLPEGIEHIPTSDPTWDIAAEQVVAWPIILPRIWRQQDTVEYLDFDLVHDHSFMGWPYMAAKDHSEVKVTWTLHWYSEMTVPPPVRNPNLVSLSNFMAAHWSGKLGVHVERVYNGIEPDRYLYSAEKGDRYLFLGRIARFKGPHEAVEIAKRARVPVDIVGEDRFTGDPPYVMNVMNSTKGTTAVYKGTVTHDEKLAFLRDAKAVLFPALWDEPFGLVPIEAMVSGTPVIALKRGALSEIIVNGKNGFLVDTVAEMVTLVEENAVEDIDPEVCRQHVLDHFTSERMAKEYESKYVRILKGDEW